MSRPKIYQINENYFTNNINENQAYLLGLIVSDGSISYKYGRFQYVCKSDDIELVNFIRNELNSGHPIKFFREKYHGDRYIRYYFANKKLINSLIDKFDIPKENHSCNNLKIPNNIPHNMINHFLRGVFDGDGSIWRPKNDSWCFAYTGGENFLLEIGEILKKECNIHYRLSFRYSKENKKSCSISTKGTLQLKRIYDFLYKDATIYLKRKHDLFKQSNEMAKIQIQKTFKTNGMEDEIRKLYISGMTQKNISKQLNLIHSSVRCCVQRLRRNKIVV